MIRHALRPGEYLAISPDAIQRDQDGFFFLLGPDAPATETVGSVAVVHVRGALAHYKTGGGDSYEAIEERVKAALGTAPSAVVLRIESPGGVVAGLNETVYRLRTASESAGIPLIAYVDEMAASAAYAIACSCSEIFAPPSAIIGSVGTISTMVSQARKDAADGYDFRLITSGTRKADGHLHAPITDAAVAAEERRNADLAAQFYKLVSEVRPLVPKRLEQLQASIYLGKQAAKQGLIDDVWSFDELLAGLNAVSEAAPTSVAPNRGNETDRRAPGPALDKTATRASVSAVAHVGTERPEVPMAVKLDALIAKTEAAIAEETDAKKLRRLTANLATYKATKADMDDDSDDQGDDDDEEDDKAKKAAENAKKMAKKAEAMKHRAKAAEHKQKAAEYEDQAKKCEADDAEEEAEEEAALPAISRGASLSDGALAAVAGSAAQVPDLAARVAQLEAELTKTKRTGLLEAALASRRITPAEAKTLAKKEHSFVVDFLAMRPNPIVAVAGEERIPDGRPGAAPANGIPPEAQQEIERAMFHFQHLTPKEQSDMRAQFESAYKAEVGRTNSKTGVGAH